jgi:hypothetical protein
MFPGKISLFLQRRSISTKTTARKTGRNTAVSKRSGGKKSKIKKGL